MPDLSTQETRTNVKRFLFISFLLISFTVSAEHAYQIPRSSVLEVTDHNTKLKYSLSIKLPRSYSNKPNRNYPVIYLLDAPYAFQLASGATRFPMNSAKMDEAILVGIGYSHGSKGASSRIRDYTPSKAKDWRLETGKAAQHITFIADVVFEHIKANYRVKPNHRTLVGNSLGGLFATHVLFTQPDLFSSYIIGSPSVWFDDEAILSQLITAPKQPTKVYISVGSKETQEFGEGQNMVAGANKLAAKIRQRDSKHIQLKINLIDGAKHSTAFPTTLIQGLDWLYGK
ncbi:alpha/beta hydrolase [Pseudoalteromonas sp. ZZD1]|uniref:alpha/beta hydrolase n=1 Tax=Pseudoalteromonas sp. ZZD1 TaxID=3139395 RepID=UPI003BAD3253